MQQQPESGPDNATTRHKCIRLPISSCLIRGRNEENERVQHGGTGAVLFGSVWFGRSGGDLLCGHHRE